MEEEIKLAKKSKGKKKLISFKTLGIGLIIITIALIGICSVYVINKDEFAKGVEETEVYTSNATIDTEKGIVVGSGSSGSGSGGKESVAGTVLEKLDKEHIFLKDTEESTRREKMMYLMNAELVTQYPYISSLDGDESKLNGVIKFYRYTDEIDLEKEDEESKTTTKEIFYIGDSWIKNLKEYIKGKVSSEYSGEQYFLCGEDFHALSDEVSKDNIKKKIDSVGSELKAIVIMLGLNDTSEAAAKKMGETIEFLSTTYEDKTIYVLKLLHVGEEYESEAGNASDFNAKIDKYNSTVKEKCSKLTNTKFINTSNKLMDEDEIYLNEKYDDKTHCNLNNNGKKIWYSNIKKHIMSNQNSSNISVNNMIRYQMTYTDEETFNEMVENYKKTGNKEVYKYFTLNEDKQFVIAYGKTIVREITTNDPEKTLEVINEEEQMSYYEVSVNADYKHYKSIEYLIYTDERDYKTLVKQYSMPFDLLWAFLVQTKDYELTKEIADLAYQTEISIGIFDNETTVISSDTQAYNKVLKYTENTELKFPKLSSPVSFNIENSIYNQVIKSCKAKIEKQTDVLTLTHPSTIHDVNIHEYYISGMTDEGIITSLSEAGELKDNIFYKASYMETRGKGLPTIGVTLADTWMGRWEAKYAEGENQKLENDTPPTEPEDYEFVEITKDKISTNLWEENGGIITKHLTEHSILIKNEAINQIMAISSSNIRGNVAITEKIIEEHINKCRDCQKQIVIACGKKWQVLEKKEKEQALKNIYLDRNYKSTKDETEETKKIRTARLEIYKHVNTETQAKDAQNKINQFKKELRNNISWYQWPTAQKAETNVVIDSYYSRIASTYEKDSTTREGTAQKFKALINKEEYHESKKAILERIEWFWEYISESKDTVELEDMIRYIFNIAFETDEFGKFTWEELEELFKKFEPKQALKTALTRGMKQLRDYIGMWEHSDLISYLNDTSGYTNNLHQYINEEKTEYYIYKDKNGKPAVGIGIINIFDANVVDRFIELGYIEAEAQLKDTSGKTAIPVEMVDSLEKEAIQNTYNQIRQQTAAADLDLEIYQVYALVSRAFDCGRGGALNGYTGISFVNAYKQYFNTEEHDMYGEMQADYGHSLYLEFMIQPSSSTNQTLGGRRKSEWTLFQTGYMDILGEWVSASGGIIEWAEEIHRYMEEYQYLYCVYFCNGGEEHKDRSQCGLNHTFEESKKGFYHTCCATYVSWVLQEAGYVTREEHIKYNLNGADCVTRLLGEKGWREISSIEEAEPGDILCYSGHVDIYAGDYTKYNAGGGSVIREAAPYKSDNFNGIVKIYRVP